MLNVDEKTKVITMTRGDTGIFDISIKDGNGDDYVPTTGDYLRFAMTNKYGEDVLVYKPIPIETLVLKLDSTDTKNLEFGKYYYDIQFTSANGDVSTIISSVIELTQEVV